MDQVTAPESTVLAAVERSGFPESWHRGSAIVLGPDGTERRILGDPSAAVLPRSTLKPFQALAVLMAGAPLEGPALAVAAGSHTGTAAHLSLVRGILAAGGVPESAL